MAKSDEVKLSTGLKGLVALTDPESWLLNVVDAHLIKREGGNRIDPGWFHPSSLANPCDAYLAFEFLGAPKRPNENPQNIRILEHGHQRDAAWKAYVGDAGLSIVDNRRADCEKCGLAAVEGERLAPDGRHMCIPEFRIRGECDDIIKNPQTGAVSIVEFKTKKQELWTKLQQPDPEHIIQVQPYMVGHGVGQTLIMYENSNTKQVKIRLVKFDPRLWENIQMRIKRILNELSHDLTPERKPGQYEKSCNFYPICAVSDFAKLVDEYREKQGLA